MYLPLNKKIYIVNILALMLLTLLIIYLLYQNLSNTKKSLFKEASNKTELIAQLVNANIDRTILEMDKDLTQIYLALEKNNENAKKVLKENKKEYLFTYIITNSKGDILEWNYNEQARIDIKNREYILYQQKQKESKLYIGKVKTSRKNNRNLFFPVSKSFFKNGKLDKIIVAIFNIDKLSEKFFNSISKNVTITLISKDGYIYKRVYSNKQKNYKGLYLKEASKFIKSKEEKVCLTKQSSFDKQMKITTFLKSKNYPFITSVSLNEAEILQRWHKQSNNMLLISSIITLGLIILLVHYTKLQQLLIKFTNEDSLTKLLNRRVFSQVATREFEIAKRYKKNISILMLDIDFFKKINDKYGHQIGDKIIIKISKDIKQSIREIDYAARYGGEEFIVLLINTSKEDAIKVANRIKDKFQNKNLVQDIKATVSIGISEVLENDTSIENSIKRSDEALYFSKESGRDKITIF